jgi:hypothetical protein
MEAWDTWLHPELTFSQFKSDVWEKNKQLSQGGLASNAPYQYATQNGSKIQFVMWNDEARVPPPPFPPPDNARYGAKVLSLVYGGGEATDAYGHAEKITGQFLNGSIMNSPAPAVVEITNHFLKTKITLDMHDMWHPKRISETGEMEEAGSNHEVWVDFEWQGPEEGDFFRPFKTIRAAVAAVADRGVVHILPGSTGERATFSSKKQIRFVASSGNVTIGAR